MNTSTFRLKSRSKGALVDNSHNVFYICSMSGLHILWFRNDLRVHDHAALKAACLAAARDGGAVMPLYIHAPETLDNAFLIESLNDLDAALDPRGAALHFRQGDPVTILSELHRDHNILGLYAHEAPRPVARDAEVETWCLRAGVAWRTFSQFGPEHGPGGQAFEDFMAAPRHAAPPEIPAAQVGIGKRPFPADAHKPGCPKGGRKSAIATLKTLLGRVSDLSRIAAETPAGEASLFEQLSPYLELGTISVREAWQAAITARNQYQAVGQDIRAARVSELIRQLSGVHQPPARPRSRQRPVGSGKDGQLSLDLGLARPG